MLIGALNSSENSLVNSFYKIMFKKINCFYKNKVYKDIEDKD